MKGLEILLGKIAEDPTRNTIKRRYLALVSELADAQQKAHWCLKLARLYAKKNPQNALQIAYVICKYEADNIEALNIIIDSFEMMGRGFQADAMRDHLANVKRKIVDKGGHDQVLKDLALDGAFSQQEAEATNPFNLSSDQILDQVNSIENNNDNPSQSATLDLTDPSPTEQENGKPDDWNFQTDLYKDGIHETTFIESATIDLADDLGASSTGKGDQDEVKSEKEVSLALDAREDKTVDLFSEHQQLDYPEAIMPSAEKSLTDESTPKINDENFDMFVDKRDLDKPLIDESVASETEAEVSFEESFSEQSEEFENLKRSNFKSYDSAVLSQMFNYYFEKSQLSRAKEIIESTAAFCSSQDWWKSAFDKLLGARASGKQLYHGLLDSQVGLYETEDLIKSYQTNGGKAPWAGLSQKLDQEKALAYFDELKENQILLQKDRFFNFYLDLAIITGYARVVIKELATRKLDYDNLEVRNSVFIRWQHAHELLDFHINLSAWESGQIKSEASFVESIDSDRFEQLLKTRMEPNFSNYKI